MLTNPARIRRTLSELGKIPSKMAATPMSDQSSSMAISVTRSSLLPTSLEFLESLEMIDFAAVDLEAVESDLMGFKQDLTTFQMELQEQKQTELLDEQLAELQKEFEISPTIDSTFYSVYMSNLGDEGLRYLEMYKEYCTFITISEDSLNYFRKTFMGLATRSEPILYAVTAWGGFYHELGKNKGDFSKPWLYMQKAAKLMCDLIGDNLKPNNKEDFFVLFAFYLIFIGIEVCTGDVRNWGGFLGLCSQLIKSFGGLARVSEIFNHSNDIQWLLSDFQFHDILSSHALLKGTLFPVEEYRAVLRMDTNYGIDPLQGINAPIFYLIAEIGNKKVELRKKWALIEEHIRNGDENAHRMRLQYYEEMEQSADYFTKQIDAVTPRSSMIELIEQDKREYEIHKSLFDLYVIIARMQLGTSIKQLPPSSAHQQLLLMKAIQLVDFLIPSKAKVALSLLLLICGMTCVVQHDRDEMIQRFRKHLKQYEIGNFQRVEELVEYAWTRNPYGHECIDWAELGNEKGWNLNVA